MDIFFFKLQVGMVFQGYGTTAQERSYSNKDTFQFYPKLQSGIPEPCYPLRYIHSIL